MENEQQHDIALASTEVIGEVHAGHSHDDPVREEDSPYKELLGYMQETFSARVFPGIPVFKVQLVKYIRKSPMFDNEQDEKVVTDLFKVYIDSLPQADQQHYTCNTCRQFIYNFGHLVKVDDDGALKSVLWNEEALGEGHYFYNTVKALREAVEKLEIDEPFFWNTPLMGIPVQKGWDHFHVVQSLENVWKRSMFGRDSKKPEQLAAIFAHEFEIMEVHLQTYSADIAKTAYDLVTTDEVFARPNVVGPATWFNRVHELRARTQNQKLQRNMLWAMVVLAPIGFAHISSTMINTLLDGLKSGEDLDVTAVKFATRLGAKNYKRKLAPPTEGNIARAEVLISELGLAPSLKRRYATAADLPAHVVYWTPKPVTKVEPESDGSIFGHLKTSKTKTKELTQIRQQSPMSWAKFSRDILPNAVKLEMVLPNAPFEYAALTTAVHPEAPPLVMWDKEEARNPVTTYRYVDGSPPHMWNLQANQLTAVTHVVQTPEHWQGQLPKFQDGVIFVLQGARDLNYKNVGLGLAPGFLRSDLKAFVMSTNIEGFGEDNVAGLSYSQGDRVPRFFRVSTDSTVGDYIVDRWE
jgi:hypothetical protein